MDRLILLAGLSAALLVGETARPSAAEAEAPAARAAASSCAATPCARHPGA
jgi:hypothetical protein